MLFSKAGRTDLRSFRLCVVRGVVCGMPCVKQENLYGSSRYAGGGHRIRMHGRNMALLSLI